MVKDTKRLVGFIEEAPTGSIPCGKCVSSYLSRSNPESSMLCGVVGFSHFPVTPTSTCSKATLDDQTYAPV